MKAIWLAFVMGGAALAAPLSLVWEGKLSWEVPAAALTWKSDLAVKGEVAPWEWRAENSFADGAWTKLLFGGLGKLGEITLSPSLEFAPQTPAFAGAKLSWAYPFHGVELQGVARLEDQGSGWGVALLGPRGALLERVRFRFNLKRHLDEILNPTFAPSFSFAEAMFSIPLPCCVPRIRGSVSFTRLGFEEIRLSFPLPWTLECGILFGASLRFRTEEARVSLFPSLMYQGPAGVDLLLGLDWDPATSALRGIKVYGFGFHGEVGNLKFRSMTGLAEDEIDLVKDPYWEVLELAWKVAGCCGEGEAAFTFYFGGAGLLGLGEVEARADLPLSDGFRLLLGLTVRLPGESTLTLGWKISL